jgi:hypothetical protein
VARHARGGTVRGKIREHSVTQNAVCRVSIASTSAARPDAVARGHQRWLIQSVCSNGFAGSAVTTAREVSDDGNRR